MKRDIRLINLAVFLWGAGEGLFFYIQPLYIERLGASPSQIGGLLSLLGWIPALTHLPSGYLSDRLPRKTFMLGGWIAGLLGTLISALARDWRALIPGLVFYGLSGYCVPVFNAYLVTAAGGRNLERVLTTNSAAFTAGSVISPAIGGFVAETASMRVVYLAAAALFALSTVSVLHISPQHPSRRRDEHAGRKVLLRGRVLRFAVPTLLSFFSMYLVFPLAPNFLEDMRGLSTSLVGTLGSVYAVGTTVLSLAIGRFKGRHRRLALLVSQGLVWLSTGSLLWAPGPAGMTLAFFLRGAYFTSRALTQARAGNLLGEARRGLAMGMTEMVVAVAQGLAPMASGWLYAGQPTRPFLAALGLIPATALLTAVTSGSRWNSKGTGEVVEAVSAD